MRQVRRMVLVFIVAEGWERLSPVRGLSVEVPYIKNEQKSEGDPR